MSNSSFPHGLPKLGQTFEGRRPRLRLAFLLLAAVFLAGCGQTAPKRAPRAPEVIVTGYVMVAPGDDGLRIKEGQLVHEGQLLFQIDPRSYLADFNQAKANLKL